MHGEYTVVDIQEHRIVTIQDVHIMDTAPDTAPVTDMVPVADTDTAPVMDTAPGMEMDTAPVTAQVTALDMAHQDDKTTQYLLHR